MLRNVATAGAVMTGAASVTSAAETTDGTYVVIEQDGEYVVESFADVEDDIGTQDHCHTYCCEDCPNLDCNNCVCEAYCHM